MKLLTIIQREFKLLFSFKDSNFAFQRPTLTAVCLGVPLFIGLYFDNLAYGLISCLAGLVVVHIPTTGSFTKRTATLLICSFGFMVAFTIGQLISFNLYLAVLGFGVFCAAIHWVMLTYRIGPPKSFFFILIASISVCQPFNLSELPTKVGLVALGTIFSSSLALIFIIRKALNNHPEEISPQTKAKDSVDYWEAILLGVFMSVSLGLGYLLKLTNPYWIPISCAAVMQGTSQYYIWQRTLQRILGTLIGLGLCWGLLQVSTSIVVFCIYIIVLQLIVELIISKNYTVAVIFITPLTIFLSEASNPLISNPNHLITMRFWEIVMGSLLGAVGGWVLYKENVRFRKQLHKFILKTKRLQ